MLVLLDNGELEYYRLNKNECTIFCKKENFGDVKEIKFLEDKEMHAISLKWRNENSVKVELLFCRNENMTMIDDL